MKLYEITQAYLDFMEMVEAGEVEEEAFADTLESITEVFEDKADNIACMIKNLEAEAAAIKNEADTLTARAKSKQGNADRLKKYLAQCMQAASINKFESARNKLTFRKSEAVEIANESAFIDYAQRSNLDNYLTYKTPIPNKTEIKKALKEGAVIEGAAIVVKQNLQIK